MMEQRLTVLALFVFAVCFLNVEAAPKPGVTEVTRTLSCCEPVKIDTPKGCTHTFKNQSMTVARVTDTDTDTSFLKPFQFLAEERMMLVPGCVNFTHEISCDLSLGRASLEIIHVSLTCSRETSPPDTAADTVQGSVVWLLVTTALMLC